MGMVCVLTMVPACNRLRAAGGGHATATSNEHQLPFHSDTSSDQNAADNLGQSQLQAQEGSVPFRSLQPRVLPAGTLLTVRLEQPLNGSQVHPGELFTAVVAEPVTIGGDTIVVRGTAVTGVVESAVASSAPGSAGYIRLVLSTITVDGKRFPLQTSSLFAREVGPAPQDKSSREAAGVRLRQGRRLTFRLTVPAALDAQSAVARGPYSIPETD